VLVSLYLAVAVSRIAEIAPGFRISLIIGGLAVVCAIFAVRTTGGRCMEFRGVMLLFVLALVTTPFSVWPGGALSFIVFTYAKVVFCFLVILFFARSAGDIRLLIVMLSGGAMALGCRLIGAANRSTVTDKYDANEIALITVCVMSFALAWFLTQRGAAAHLAGAASAVMACTVVLTSSRGGFVAAAGIVAILLVRLRGRIRRRRLAVVVVGLVITMAVAPSVYWQRMATIWTAESAGVADVDYDDRGIWAARWDVWNRGIELMLAHPIVGVGAGMFEVAEGLSHGGVGRWTAAHNSFIQVGAELGVLGLGVFVFLLWRAIRNCREAARRAKGDPERLDILAIGCEVALYGYIIGASGLSHAYSYLPYVFVAASVVIVRLARARTG
jgi:O-antigen ligase